MNDKRHLGGFAQSIGETQVPGDPRIHGIIPGPGPTPIGPAPPHIRQVLSVYDSRPIGGYDFVLSDSFDSYIDLPEVSVQSPQGYITVVRRIEIEAQPGLLLSPFGILPTWVFVNNGVTAIAWEWNTGKVLTDEGIDTFFVVQPNVPFGIRCAALTGIAVDIVVRFIGNLILDVNEPPTEQVGALPHAVYPITKEF